MVIAAGASSASAASGGSFLSSAGGSALISGLFGAGSVGLNALSSHKAFRRQKDLMKLQAQLNYDYNKKATLNQYNWLRQGLTDADYNPMLAMTNSSASQSWTGSQNSPMADYSGLGADFANASNAMSNLEMLDNALKMQKAQTDNIAADTEMKRSQTYKFDQEGFAEQIKNKYLDDRQKTELENILAQSSYFGIKAACEQYNAESTRLFAESNAKLVNGQVEYLKKSGFLTDVQAELLGKEIKWYGPNHVSGMIKDILSGAGSLFGGISGLRRPGPGMPSDFTDVYNGANGYTYKHSRYYH